MELSRKANAIEASPTLAVDAMAKKMIGMGIDVVGFGVGEPDFDTPEHIIKAAKVAMDEGFTRYTAASGIPKLKEAVCEKLLKDNNLDYKSSQIVISNGAKHSLTNAFMAVLNPGDEVLIPAPFWVSYPEMVKIADGVPVILNSKEENSFKFTAQDLRNAVTKKTKAIIINSPSNPTGSVYSKEELMEIGEVATENDLIIISDEIYEELIYDDKKHFSIASFSEDLKNRTIVVNGMSKAYAMTGWRIGYSASNQKIADLIGNIQSQSTSNPNSIAQKAAIAALNGSKDCVYKMKDEFEKRRNYMYEKINKINGVSCIKPDGAFYIMMNVSKLFGKKYIDREINNSNHFSELLLEKSWVAVVAGGSFGAEGYVRISYANSMDNIVKGLDRIEQFIDRILL
jgi:aspartate aminotransferase